MVASQWTARKTVDHVDFDFEFLDVFGPPPSPQQPSVPNTNELLVYDEPEVICSRSHSLVGPTTFTNQSLKLSLMALQELEKSPFVDVVVDDDGSLVNIESVGLEDFEILKVVGQGAFAKVYQVRKHGSSEIFAMKVMRKNRIFVKDQAEYMKAERDILTHLLSQTRRMVKGQADHAVFKAQNEIKEHKNCRTLF